MDNFEKLVEKILLRAQVSYDEAEIVMRELGFSVRSTGSHHIFRKDGYRKNILIKRRRELHSHQLKDLRDVLEAHGYTKRPHRLQCALLQ